MNEQLKERLAHFEGAEVVYVVGVLKSRVKSWSPIEEKSSTLPDPLGFAIITLEVWKVGKEEANLTPLRVLAILTFDQYFSCFYSYDQEKTFSIIRLQARFAQHPDGFREVLLEEWLGSAHDAELDKIYRHLHETTELDLPPIPPLKSSKSGPWQGTLSLPLWNDFYLKSGYMKGDRTPYRRTEFGLRFDCDEENPVQLGDKQPLPTPEQIAACVYLIENEKAVQDAVLQAMLDHYPQWQEDYYVDENYMPIVSDASEFQSLLVLLSVSITLEAKEGFAYVLLDMIAQWEIEHGMGALLHKDRVVAIGDHDSVWDAIKQDTESEQSGTGA